MRTIYIDEDYKCHLTNDGTMRELLVSCFDDACDALIEGCRYVPEGETWTRSDGEIFEGEMISPWRDLSLLEEFQAQYEEMSGDAPADLLEELGAAYVEGVNSI